MTDAVQHPTAAQTTRSARVKLSRVERFLAHLGGVNPDRLEMGPLDDRQAAARTGLALTTSVLFVSYVSANALAIALGDSRLAVIAGLPAAFLIASAIGFVDHAMIQSHWMEAGLAAARRRGFTEEASSSLGAKLRHFGGALTVGFVRIGLSASLAFSIATVLELQIFRNDIAAQVAADQRAANAPVLARAQRTVQAGVDAANAEAARLDATLATSEKRADALERKVADEIATLAAIRDARLLELAREHDVAEKQSYQATRARNAEHYGQRIEGVGTGVPGKGTAFHFAEKDAEIASTRAEELAAQFTALRQAAMPAAANSGELEAAHAEVASLRAEQSKAVAERDRRSATRDVDVQAAVVADPAYVPVVDGLVTRLRAMRELEAAPAVFAFTLAIKILLMATEMAGLISKLILIAPGRFGLFNALDFERDAAEAIDAAGERIEDLADAADEREERRESRDRRRHRRQTAAVARKRFASALRDAIYDDDGR